jgi:hypothetical protein
MDILAGRRGYGLAGRADCVADGMLIFRRCMLVAMLTEDAPAEKAEGIVLGALAAVGYTVPTPIPAHVKSDVVSLTLFIRNYAHEYGKRKSDL